MEYTVDITEITLLEPTKSIIYIDSNEFLLI